MKFMASLTCVCKLCQTHVDIFDGGPELLPLFGWMSWGSFWVPGNFLEKQLSLEGFQVLKAEAVKTPVAFEALGSSKKWRN